MWLTGRLMPDFKTIADFRHASSGPAIRAACAQFVVLCRQFSLFHADYRCDRREQVQGDQQSRQELSQWPRSPSAALSRWRPASRVTPLAVLDRADREDGDMAEAETIRLREKIEGLQRQMQALRKIGKQG